MSLAILFNSFPFTDAPSHAGPHPLTPSNLEKHVAKASPVSTPAKKPTHSKGALEFADLPARYRRAPLSEAEMEAIEVNTSYHHINT